MAALSEVVPHHATSGRLSRAAGRELAPTTDLVTANWLGKAHEKV